MKESEATAGQKLLALVTAMNLGVSFSQAIKSVPEKIHPSWDDTAFQLQRMQIDAIPDPARGTLSDK